MKLPKNLAICLMLALLGPLWAGCQIHGSVTALTGGYEELSHPAHTLIALDEPLPSRMSFQFRSPDGKVTEIWPSLYGVSEVINGDLAIFVGDKAYREPDPVTHPRLFAVKSPALPLDITDEVMSRWAQANGRNFKTAQDRINLITPEESGGGLLLHLAFSLPDDLGVSREAWPDQGTLQLSWAQVDEIMRAVKTNGVEHKDLRWHTPYVGAE